MKYATAKLVITHPNGDTDEVFTSLETPPGKYNDSQDVAHRVIDAFYDSLNDLMKTNNQFSKELSDAAKESDALNNEAI